MASVRDFALALEIRVKEEEVEEKEATREPVRRACADGSSSYYEATHDCAGYVYCPTGVPGQSYPCGDGMLYDQARAAVQLVCPDKLRRVPGGGGGGG